MESALMRMYNGIVLATDARNLLVVLNTTEALVNNSVLIACLDKHLDMWALS